MIEPAQAIVSDPLLLRTVHSKFLFTVRSQVRTHNKELKHIHAVETMEHTKKLSLILWKLR